MLRRFRAKEIGSLLAQFAHHHHPTVGSYGTSLTDLRQFIAGCGFQDCTSVEIVAVLTELHHAGIISVEYWSKWSKSFVPWSPSQASLASAEFRVLPGRSQLNL